MKKIYLLLLMLIVGIGSTWADGSAWQLTTDTSNPVYYKIGNSQTYCWIDGWNKGYLENIYCIAATSEIDCATVANATGDNAFWYFVDASSAATAAGVTLNDGVKAVYIGNKSWTSGEYLTDYTTAAHSTTGTIYYIQANSATDAGGNACSGWCIGTSQTKTDEKFWNYQSRKVGTWVALKDETYAAGSTWEFEQAYTVLCSTTDGGVSYKHHNVTNTYTNGQTFYAPTGLSASSLSEKITSGYAINTLSVDGTTATITYNDAPVSEGTAYWLKSYDASTTTYGSLTNYLSFTQVSSTCSLQEKGTTVYFTYKGNNNWTINSASDNTGNYLTYWYWYAQTGTTAKQWTISSVDNGIQFYQNGECSGYLGSGDAAFATNSPLWSDQSSSNGHIGTFVPVTNIDYTLTVTGTTETVKVKYGSTEYSSGDKISVPVTGPATTDFTATAVNGYYYQVAVDNDAQTITVTYISTAFATNTYYRFREVGESTYANWYMYAKSDGLTAASTATPGYSIFYAAENGTTETGTVNLKAINGKYIQAYVSDNTQIKLGTDAVEYSATYISDGKYTLSATASTNDHRFLHYNANDKVVGWTNTTANSQWYKEEVTVVSAKSDLNTLLTSIKSSYIDKAGSEYGQYSGDTYTALSTQYTTSKAVYDNANATIAQVLEAFYNLDAIAKPTPNLPTTGIYQITSNYSSIPSGTTIQVCDDSKTNSAWLKTTDIDPTYRSMWVVKQNAAGSAITLQNLYTGMYIGAVASSNFPMSSTSQDFTMNYLDADHYSFTQSGTSNQLHARTIYEVFDQNQGSTYYKGGSSEAYWLMPVEGNNKNSGQDWNITALTGYDIYTVTVDNGYTVTYTPTSGTYGCAAVGNGGYIVVATGTTIATTELAISSNKSGYTAAFTVDASAKTITVSWNAKPFTATTITDGKFASDTKWYRMKFMESSCYAKHDLAEGISYTNVSNTVNGLQRTNYYYCFVPVSGVENGYKIYSYIVGPSKSMYNGGTNKEISTFTEDGTTFILANTDHATIKGFTFRVKDNTTAFLNDINPKVGVWNATDAHKGSGSTIIFEEVSEEDLAAALALPQAGNYYAFKCNSSSSYITGTLSSDENHTSYLAMSSEATNYNKLFYFSGLHLYALESGKYASAQGTGFGQAADVSSAAMVEFYANTNGSFCIVQNNAKSIYGAYNWVDGKSETKYTGAGYEWTVEDGTVPVTITTANAATFIAPIALDVPTGVTAKYLVTQTPGETSEEKSYTLVYNKINKTIPANTAVVLTNTTGTESTEYSFTPALAADAITGNLLFGYTSATTVTGSGHESVGTSGTIYALGNISDVVAFYHFTGSTYKAGKGYLDASSFGAIGARSFNIFDPEEGTTTTINTINGETETVPADGKFLVNGKIVVVKNGVKYNVSGQQMK